MAETIAKPNTSSPDASGDRDKSRGRSSPAQENLQGRELVFIPYEGFLGTSTVKEQLRRSLAAPAQTAVEEPSGEASFLDGLLGTSMLEPPIERHAEIMSDPRFSHSANTPTSSRIVNRLHQTYGNGHVQRVTDYIQALQEGGHSDGQVSDDIEQTIARKRKTGKQLERGTRSHMESLLGRDFGDVSIHTDSAADSLAKALQAKAFTVGSDVFFHEGAYQPGSISGKKLLGHELTHVAQQDKTTALRVPSLQMSPAPQSWRERAKNARSLLKTNEGKAKTLYKQLILEAAQKAAVPETLPRLTPTLNDIDVRFRLDATAAQKASLVKIHPGNFWRWIQYGSNVIKDNEAFTISSIEHELEHCKDSHDAYKAWEQAGKPDPWLKFENQHVKNLGAFRHLEIHGKQYKKFESYSLDEKMETIRGTLETIPTGVGRKKEFTGKSIITKFIADNLSNAKVLHKLKVVFERTLAEKAEKANIGEIQSIVNAFPQMHKLLYADKSTWGLIEKMIKEVSDQKLSMPKPALQRAAASDQVGWESEPSAGLQRSTHSEKRHAEIMSDPRFSHSASAPTSSRIVNRLHQSYGNTHILKVLNYSRVAPQEAPAVATKKNCEVIHLSTVAVVQRTPSPEVNGTVSVKIGGVNYYDVTGITLAQIAKQLDPTEYGRCTWRYDYTYGESNGTTDSVDVTLTISYRMPHWKGKRKASKAARKEWQRMISRLWVHERGHEAICKPKAYTLRTSLLNKPEHDLPDIYDRFLEAVQDKNDAYDTRTDHGANQRVTLDTSIQ